MKLPAVLPNVAALAVEANAHPQLERLIRVVHKVSDYTFNYWKMFLESPPIFGISLTNKLRTTTSATSRRVPQLPFWVQD